MTIRLVVFLALLGLWSPRLWAQEEGGEEVGPRLPKEPAECLDNPRLAQCNSVVVGAIEIEGTERTKDRVVLRELLFSEGDLVSRTQIEESIRRLLNLGMFRFVDWTLLPEEPGSQRYVLRLIMTERWTLLPSFRLSQGGGVTLFRTGISDGNAFGRGWRWALYYGRVSRNEDFFSLEGAQNSLLLFLTEPRLLDTFLRLDFGAGFASRARTLYDDQGQVEGGFNGRTLLASLAASYEWFWWLNGGLGLEVARDEFSYGFLPEEIRQLEQENFGGLPSDEDRVTLSGFMSFGRINLEDFYFSGAQFVQTWSHANTLWGSTFNLTTLTSTLTAYKRLKWRGNLALQLSAGTSDASREPFQYYLGGVSQVRGYPDSYFRGQSFWAGNLEYRVAPFVASWLAAQVVGFADLGGVSQQPLALDRFDALTVGLGLRLLLPKFHRAVARFDYAWPLTRGLPASLNFGAQQFF